MAEDTRTLKELQEENLRIQNEHLREQTLFYKEQNAQLAGQREQRKNRHESNERTLADGRRKQAATAATCTHQKGGKGDDLVNNRGNSPNGCFADQQQPNGEIWRLCTRCFATWKPGDTAETHPSGIGYAEIMRRPTNNSMSSSVLYHIPQAARA